MVDILHRRSGRVLVTVEGDRLSGTNLSGAYLIHADLREADLSGAMLVYADLRGADLTGAILCGANLRGANLIEADLSCADLSRADLAEATLSQTVFHDCTTLHRARGLGHLRHRGPSLVNERTLRACAAGLPSAFLRGVGNTRSDVERIREMYPEVEGGDANDDELGG